MAKDVYQDISLPRSQFDAVIFDMDGVITKTATLHAAAWKKLFDEFLTSRLGPGETLRPFDIDGDYLRYVDGKPRYDGVAAFLASRGISIPHGGPSDPPTAVTVCGLGNLKNVYFWGLLEERGVEVFDTTVALIHSLKAAGMRTGIFSASRNSEAVLRSGHVLDLFDAKVDGADADALGLPGKPDPAMLLELARRLDVTPNRTAVAEDSEAGVRAGHDGGFGLVIGINRAGDRGRLLDAEADVEVSDLEEVQVLN